MTDATEADSGSIETPKDVGQGNPALARFWTVQLNLADKAELKWRKRAKRVNDLYANAASRSDEDRATAKFNILFSNVQTLKPALLPSIPKADVRKRFRDDDRVGGIAADMLERCAQTLCDDYDFAHVCEMAVLDRCLGGRAVVREDYEVDTEDDDAGNPQRIVYQRSVCRNVVWDDFRRGPGRKWDEITWVAFKHKLTRDQMRAMFGPKIGDLLPLNLEPEDKDALKDDDPNIYKQGEVWEVHDKDTRQIIWICKDYKDGPCKVEPDKNKFTDFFPIPRPLLAQMRTDSQEPVDEFRQYESQAAELDKVTRRIDKLISALKSRGIYPGQIQEFAQLATAGDNQMVPSKSADVIAAIQQGKKLEDLIWMWPLDSIIQALQQLYIQREAVKQTIYEIIGISDILRGQVDPQEKLGQSQLKAASGAKRMDDARKEVERFLRDALRLKVEIIAEHFSPEQIMMMSGIKLPTAAEKEQAQQMAAMAQQQMQPGAPPPQVPPEVEGILKSPTIEEVMAVIRSDAMRTFRVDVETDQTVVGDEAQEKQTMIDFLKGTAEYWTAMGPIIQGGFPLKVAVGLYSATARRFKLGRDVEDEIAALQDAPPPPPQEDPALETEKLKAKTEAEKMERETQRDQQKHGMEMETMQREGEYRAQEHQMKMQELAAKQEAMIVGAQVKAMTPQPQGTA